MPKSSEFRKLATLISERDHHTKGNESSTSSSSEKWNVKDFQRSHSEKSLSESSSIRRSKSKRQLPSLKKLRTLSARRSESLGFEPLAKNPSANSERTLERQSESLRRSRSVNLPLIMPSSPRLQEGTSPRTLEALSQLSRQYSQEAAPSPKLRVPKHVRLVEEDLSSTTTTDSSTSDASSVQSGDRLLHWFHLVEPARSQLYSECHPDDIRKIDEGPSNTNDEIATPRQMNTNDQKFRLSAPLLFSTLLFKTVCFLALSAVLTVLILSIKGVNRYPANNDNLHLNKDADRNSSRAALQVEACDTLNEITGDLQEKNNSPFDEAYSELDSAFATLRDEFEHQRIRTVSKKGINDRERSQETKEQMLVETSLDSEHRSHNPELKDSIDLEMLVPLEHYDSKGGPDDISVMSDSRRAREAQIPASQAENRIHVSGSIELDEGIVPSAKETDKKPAIAQIGDRLEEVEASKDQLVPLRIQVDNGIAFKWGVILPSIGLFSDDARPLLHSYGVCERVLSD